MLLKINRDLKKKIKVHINSLYLIEGMKWNIFFHLSISSYDLSGSTMWPMGLLFFKCFTWRDGFLAYTLFLRSANEAHERRLLTNIEYVLEGRFHTREQLNLLRQNCQRMPIMNTWRVAGALSNTHRYYVRVFYI